MSDSETRDSARSRPGGAAATGDSDALSRLEATAHLALPRFGIAATAPVALIHHRENAVFRVDDPADGSRWAMRVHRDGYRTADEIRSELGWMDALRDAGVPTPRARPGADGDPLQLVTPPGDGPPLQVDVLAWIEGHLLAAGEAREEREVYRLVGRTSALIQQHGRTWTPPPGFSRPVWDIDALIGPRALWGDYADLAVLTAEQLALMHRAAERVRRRLEAFGRAPDRFGLTHGDLMPDNILVAGGVPHVIDFDDAGYGWYLYDLATLLADKVADPAFAAVRDAWAAGYRTVAPLPDEHLAELDALVMARLLLGLGWMHTRRETAMARDFTPLVVALACVQAEKLLEDDMTDAKRRALDLAARYVCPDRVRTFEAMGVDLVIGRREGYRLWDLDGRELLDFHLNGGVFNLGHRHPEVVAALRDALDTLDIGNHHFPSVARAELAEALVRTMPPGDLQYVVFSPSGGEAIDVAIKSARHATQRRTIISIHGGYHGHTGLALATGEERFARLFLSGEASEDFVRVPFNDLEAMEAALGGHQVAAVILETIPATCGFPLPAPGYLPGVQALCARHGALYVADEVQTGLGRTGRMWGVECFGVTPDILVTGKGLSGGLYPIAATVLAPRAARWLEQDGWGHLSTFGGAEVGCRVAQKVLEITTRPGVLDGVQATSDRLAAGLERLRTRYPDWLVEIRRQGVVMGLRFAHERGGQLMTRALYDAGLWAMFAGFDTSVLQFKAGLLLDAASCDEALRRFEHGLQGCLALLGR